MRAPGVSRSSWNPALDISLSGETTGEPTPELRLLSPYRRHRIARGSRNTEGSYEEGNRNTGARERERPCMGVGSDSQAGSHGPVTEGQRRATGGGECAG